jgi:hypothetical protein
MGVELTFVHDLANPIGASISLGGQIVIDGEHGGVGGNRASRYLRLKCSVP